MRLHAFDPSIVPQCLPKHFRHDSEGPVKHSKTLDYINATKQKQIRICQFIEARGRFVGDRACTSGQSSGRRVQEFCLGIKGGGGTPPSLIAIQFVRVCMYDRGLSFLM
jgi:hypothetical protein